MSGSPLVLDCSVLVKVLSHEPLSGEARALLALPRRFLAPDLMPIELGNVLWKKVQRGILTPDEALGAQVGIHALAPVRILAGAAYQPRALALALAYGRSFYDSLYLAVAEAEGGIFVTADERVGNALRGTAMEPLLHWLGAGAVPD